MIIKTLVENTSISDQFRTEHGLSLYIETPKHKLLFDLGQNDLFLENARKMNVDIADVDLVVISHGHYDHGGGLKVFLRENSKATIYIQQNAYAKHYVKHPHGETFNIGLVQESAGNPRVVFVDDYLRIDEELELFSAVKGRELFSSANQVLLTQAGEMIIEDSFDHEQNLIIAEKGKLLLVAGCSHNGIVNIVKHMIEIKGRPAEHVMGGFHLFNPNTRKSEDEELIKAIGLYLVETGSQYYTGHCTGLEPYAQLKAIMQDKIQYLATGRVVEI